MTKLIDLTPKFQRFYALARPADPDTRWALWQEHYNFAAVPPIPEADKLARQLLNNAWEGYASLPADLSGEVKRLQEQAENALQSLQTLFQCDPPEFTLVTYVGGFEGNAFVAGQNLNMPVEMPSDWAQPVLTHELTHLFHHKLNGSSGGWQRSLAAFIVEEGLATRTTQHLYPDLALENQIGTPDWLQTCESHKDALIQDALPLLGKSDDATLLRFLRPEHSPLGLERTAYALGWWFAGQWLDSGRTLNELARVPEGELPTLLRQYWA